MSVFERIAIFIPRVSWPFLILALLLPLISWFTQGGREAIQFALVTLLSLAIILPVLLSPYWVYRIVQVRRSRRRFAGIPVHGRIPPAVAGWLVVVVAALVVAAGWFGWIPNIYVTREIEKSRGQAEAQLGCIQAVEGKLGKAAITTEPWNEASVAKVTGIKPSAQNFAVMHRENLGDLTRNLAYPSAMPVVLCNPYNTIAAASLVRKGSWPGGDPITLSNRSEWVRELLDSLERLRYLLVIRKAAYQPPALNVDGTFTAGRYNADALLFEIQGGRFLGGFQIGSTNSFIVRGAKIDVETLERDLSSNAEESLRNHLADHLPAVTKDEQFCRH